MSLLNDLLNVVTGRGRELALRAFGQSAPSGNASAGDVTSLVRLLLSGRGEASGVAIAREVMTQFERLTKPGQIDFLNGLATIFGPDPAEIRAAFAAYDADPSAQNFQTLTGAIEPPRQEIIRRLNLAPGNTERLVEMRAALLAALPDNPALGALDADFAHLFSSWFNRGFLVLRRVDWSTPANVLERIIRYEAVHAIEGWDDLRRRLEPPDRRCFAFFHPALADEPLIFVEVALTADIPAAIQPVLSVDRNAADPALATTAVFYSISNCQKGLAGISFGNFLIKQVVEELRKELPQIKTFVTLSPVPGFARWLAAEMGADKSEFVTAADRVILRGLGSAGWGDDAKQRQAVNAALEPLLAAYFLKARSAAGKIIDPVARFHLGNGARLERLNPGGDLSAKGMAESHGAMVNYLYDLKHIEANHEGFAAHGKVAASSLVKKLARGG